MGLKVKWRGVFVHRYDDQMASRNLSPRARRLSGIEMSPFMGSRSNGIDESLFMGSKINRH